MNETALNDELWLCECDDVMMWWGRYPTDNAINTYNTIQLVKEFTYPTLPKPIKKPIITYCNHRSQVSWLYLGCGEGGLYIRHLNLPEAAFLLDFKRRYTSFVLLQSIIGIINGHHCFNCWISCFSSPLGPLARLRSLSWLYSSLHQLRIPNNNNRRLYRYWVATIIIHQWIVRCKQTYEPP